MGDEDEEMKQERDMIKRLCICMIRSDIPSRPELGIICVAKLFSLAAKQSGESSRHQHHVAPNLIDEADGILANQCKRTSNFDHVRGCLAFVALVFGTPGIFLIAGEILFFFR